MFASRKDKCITPWHWYLRGKYLNLKSFLTSQKPTNYRESDNAEMLEQVVFVSSA